MHYKKYDGMMCRPAVVLKGDEELTEDQTLVTCKFCLRKLSKPAPVASAKKGRAQIPGEGWKKDIPKERPLLSGVSTRDKVVNPLKFGFKGTNPLGSKLLRRQPLRQETTSASE